MTDLDKLIEAVGAGEYTSVEHMAHRAFGGKSYYMPEGNALLAGRAYQGSMTSALALFKAVLPGWTWLVRSTDDADVRAEAMHQSKFLANIWRSSGNPNTGQEHFPEWSDTPARALLLATLKALREKEGGE